MIATISAVACVLFVAGCGVARKSTTTKSTVSIDTVYHVETVKIDTVRVPAERVGLSVPVDVIRSIGTSGLSDKNGRASIRLVRIRDTIYVTANCDSLERLVVSKDTEKKQVHRQAETDKSVVKKVDVTGWVKIATIIGCLLSICHTIYSLTKLNPIKWLKVAITKLLRK